VSATIASAALVVSTIAVLYSVVTLKGQTDRVEAMQNAIDALSEYDAESEEVAIFEKQKSDAIEELKTHAGVSDSDRIVAILIMAYSLIVWIVTLPEALQPSVLGTIVTVSISSLLFMSPTLWYFARLRRNRLRILKEVSPDCDLLTLGQFAEKRRWSAELEELREKWRNQTEDEPTN
jgi:Flp pilus assembly protein TadB